MKTIIAFIQTRMKSSRLPGKALLSLCGRTVIGHLIDRIRAVSLIDDIVVATSKEKEDDSIQEFCENKGVACVRGSETDVCGRMYDATKRYPSHHYLRFCGDAPMQDPEVIEKVIRFHLKAEADYTTNGIGETRTFPLGIDVRIAKKRLFTESFQKRDNSLREMENPLAQVHNYPERYNISLYKAAGPLKRPELRFIVDYPEDMDILREVFNALYYKNPLFGCHEAIVYVDSHPHLKKLMNLIKDHLRHRKSQTSKDIGYRLKC